MYTHAYCSAKLSIYIIFPPNAWLIYFIAWFSSDRNFRHIIFSNSTEIIYFYILTEFNELIDMDSVIFPAAVMKKPRHGTRFRSPATRFLSCFKYIRMTSAKASVSIIFRSGCPSSYPLEPSSISAGGLHGFTRGFPSAWSWCKRGRSRWRLPWS